MNNGAIDGVSGVGGRKSNPVEKLKKIMNDYNNYVSNAACGKRPASPNSVFDAYLAKPSDSTAASPF